MGATALDAAVPAVDLSVVVVSYECLAYVRECLEALTTAPTASRLEVVVVDNGSTDGTVAALTDLHPLVRVVPMGYNAGFAKACNVGAATAAGRLVLFLNPDTRVEPGALDTLVSWLDRHPRVGVAAPQLLNADGSDQRTARSFPTPSAGLFGRRSPLTRLVPGNPWSQRFLSPARAPGDLPYRVDWVSGAAMMVPADVIRRTGGFDESFFLFWEDADWCRRLADAGLEVWCVPSAHVVHDEGGTREHRWSPRVAAHFHRGAYLYWRNHHAPQWWNPVRWVAAAALAARCGGVLATQRARSPVRAEPEFARSRVHAGTEWVSP